MLISTNQLQQDFSDLITEVIGTTRSAFTGAAEPERASPQDLIFLSNPKYVECVLKSEAGGVVAALKLRDQILTKAGETCTVFLSPNPDLLKAQILSRYWLRKQSDILPGTPAIHPTSVVHPSVHLGEHLTIGPHVTIGARAQIGDYVAIGANCVIEEGVQIGAHSELAPLVFVSRRCQIGKNCRIDANTSIGSSGYGFAPDAQHRFHHIPQQGWVTIEDDVEIGSNCAIDRGALAETRIGRGTKMDNLCHIAHNCLIGEDCMITAGFRVAGSTRIGNRFKCGGGCKMAGHLNIADDVTLAGGTTVMSSLSMPGEYGGHPALPMRDYLKAYSSMAHLTQMRKNLSKIMKHLELEQE